MFIFVFAAVVFVGVYYFSKPPNSSQQQLPPKGYLRQRFDLARELFKWVMILVAAMLCLIAVSYIASLIYHLF